MGCMGKRGWDGVVGGSGMNGWREVADDSTEFDK